MKVKMIVCDGTGECQGYGTLAHVAGPNGSSHYLDICMRLKCSLVRTTHVSIDWDSQLSLLGVDSQG